MVTLIHCYYGYTPPAGRRAWAWRRAAPSAVIVAIVLLNLLLSFLFWGDGGTVRLTG